MYKLAKSIAVKLFSPSQLLRYEVALRNITATFYHGSTHRCTLCEKTLRKFIFLENGDLLCPACGSLARDRRLWLLLQEKFLARGITVLDFSPSRCITRKLERQDITYMPTDLSGRFLAKFSYDITALPLKEATTDLILCYHILEHIDDDNKAMSELYRVMKPGSKALVQTPFKDGDIYENPEIITPQDREHHFGQDDHVRVYSVGGLAERLENAGFVVKVLKFKADAYPGLAEGETVLELTKPQS
ncbi:MAG: class I SAM-dependent methyltransferase [Flavobacterium sp.]